MGLANSGGSDAAVISTGSELYAAVGDNLFNADLAQGWNTAEFNIFGDGCSTQAIFNNGSTLVARTSVANAVPVSSGLFTSTCSTETFPPGFEPPPGATPLPPPEQNWHIATYETITVSPPSPDATRDVRPRA